MDELFHPKLPLGTKSKKLFIILAILISAFLLAPWISFTLGSGRVTSVDPNERVQTLSAPVDGFVHRWYVKEGQKIKEGDIIADLTDNDPDLITRLDAQKIAAKQAYSASKSVRQTSEIDYNRQESLFNEGLSSRKEFELAKIKYEESILKEADKQSSLVKSESEFAKQSSQRITAPRDGIITRIMPGERGQLLKKGSAVVIFTPVVKNPAVEIWIDGNDVAMIQPKQSVRLQFEGWPSIQIPGWTSLAIGTFKGEVLLVDQTSATDGKFRVLVTPSDERWPSEKLLRQGMQSRGYIKIRNSIVIRELWRVLNGYPALTRPIQEELNFISSKNEDKK
jgi:multidrug efflux pump subunit AcrA (membrane-fusion protein)